MNIDGITLQCITKELQKELTGGQITKIYQPRARTLYFQRHRVTSRHYNLGRISAHLHRGKNAAYAGYAFRPLHVFAQIL